MGRESYLLKIKEMVIYLRKCESATDDKRVPRNAKLVRGNDIRDT